MPSALSKFLILLCLSLAANAFAEDTPARGALQAVIQQNFADIKRSSAKTVATVLDAIAELDHPGTSTLLQTWQNKQLWYRKSDDLLVYVEELADKRFRLLDIESGASIAAVDKTAIKQIKPNSGVRAKIGAALVRYQLLDADIDTRRRALQSLQRNGGAQHLPFLRQATSAETDPTLRAEFANIERLLTISYARDANLRIEAINALRGDLALETRATLNPLLTNKLKVAEALPANANIARVITPGTTVKLADESGRKRNYLDRIQGRSVELSQSAAYQLLVEAELAPPLLTRTEQETILIANIAGASIAGYAIADMADQALRDAAFDSLAAAGLARTRPTLADVEAALSRYVFYAQFDEPSAAVTAAAQDVLNDINRKVWFSGKLDLMLDATSLASIYFLAAIGLAITFGVMRVINMAHGEFIMMGAYSGYIAQQIISDYTLSILFAIPFAFIVTFIIGILLERLVIRHLYDRPLETLLATFGVSIALQQIAKNIFGTQARPLTAPGWLDGSLVVNDVIAISWIRIAIFALGAVFFILLWWSLNHTRFGLETRAVTQNPSMASSMGIAPSYVNMLTFGLGSGIAGIAGVAIGLYAKVTSEMGSDYIVQSFMTVVVGGVGNIWGTLAGATMIGILQKLIENFSPANTLAAQTYMILFIIIFIQFRPNGFFPIRGRHG